MRAIFFLTSAVLLSPYAFGQLLTFEFEGHTGTEIFSGSNFNAPGVEASTIFRGSGVVAASNADRFNSTSWTPAGVPDDNDYLSFNIAAVPGYNITITDIRLSHQRSGTGPVNFVIRSGLDSYLSNATNIISIGDVTTTQTSVFNFIASISTQSSINIRIYGYSSEGGGGSWGPGDFPSGTDLIVNGTVSPITLPVTFKDVRAYEKYPGMQIEWTNATESDIVQYSIERSANGRDFTSIGMMTPICNDGSKAAYKWQDVLPFPITNFYRIQSLEINGKIIYSSVVRVEKNICMAVYPNPVVSDQLILQMDIPPGSYMIRIWSVLGDLKHTATLSNPGGVRTETLAIGNLKAGMYYLQFGDTIRSFLKQ